MRLNPDDEGFGEALGEILGREVTPQDAEMYRENLRQATAAGFPLGRHSVWIDDFFPLKQWRTLAVAGYMLPDPYTGSAGVEEISPGVYRVVVRGLTRSRTLEVALTLRLMEDFEESRLVFLPLLDRFCAGEDHTARAVKVSDSGRIRNELQTLASEAIEHIEGDRMRLDLSKVADEVLPAGKKQRITEVLKWYQAHHPIWFGWLELVE